MGNDNFCSGKKSGPFLDPFFGPKFGHFCSKIRFSDIFFESAHQICLKLGQKHQRILKCNHATIFITFNVRTLGIAGRFQELVECSSRHGIDVIAVQEHRFYNPDVSKHLEYRSLGSYQLVTSSAWKNSINSTIGGPLRSFVTPYLELMLRPFLSYCFMFVQVNSNKLYPSVIYGGNQFVWVQ